MNALTPIIAPQPLMRPSEHVRKLSRERMLGIILIVGFGGVVVAWSTMATLQGAVAAGGHFSVASEVKKIQHPTGGVVASLPVKEGQHVTAGDVVLRLDETLARANSQIIGRQLDEFTAKTARLMTERDGLDSIVLSRALQDRADDPDMARIIASEERSFAVRRAARDGQRAQLRKRIGQLADEIRGLSAQQASKEREARIIVKELSGVEELFRRNLIQLTRLSTLQREQASIEGELGNLMARIAQTEGKIAEIELQIIQIGEEHRAEVMKELTEAQTRIGELTERKTAADLQLRQIDLRTPVTGFVHQLAVHTVGGVLQGSEAAMLIVPGDDQLALDSRISPSDIDQIVPGQKTRIKVQAGNLAANPELTGTVSRISADVTRDERQNQSYYTVRVDLPASELKRLPVKVIAGMQAEIFIETVERRPLDFLLKPISAQFARTFRER